MNMDPALIYRQSYGQGCSPVRLVVLLYEQLIKDVQTALLTLESGNVEARVAAVNHAFEVAAELQVRLDRERGGEVARNLEQFYQLFRVSLLEAQIKCSKAIFQNQIANLLSLREAWLEVERSTSQAFSQPAQAPPASPAVSASASSASDWKA
jgi:flagellar protein FliS